jgi:ABC-type glycerol-3-phosphate transport system substrate-binding protein
MRSQRPSRIGYLVVALLLVLTGCDLLAPASTSTPTMMPPTLSPAPPTEEPSPTPESQPALVILELWLPEELDPYGDAPGADVLAQQLTDFNQAHTDLQVEVSVKRAHGRGGILDYLRTAPGAAPSVLPDLVVLDAADLGPLIGAGLIQPLDPLLPPDEANDRFPFAVQMATVDEQTVGYVIGADMQHLVYRPARLDAPPVSWTQVITPPVSFIFPGGGNGQQVNDATLIQYMAAGGKVTDSEGNPWLDEQVLVSVLTFYSDCIGTGALSPAVILGITDADQSWERFKAGAGDMAVVQASGYWQETLADVSVETAVASVPTRNGFPFTIARGAWAMAMVTDDPNRQALAMTLLNWLAAPDRNAQWTQATGYLPSTRSALRMWDISSEDRNALRGILEAAVPAPSPDVMAVVGPAMQGAVEAVLRGGSTPEQAAAAAVEGLER